LESFLQPSVRRENLLATKRSAWVITWILLAALATLNSASLLARSRQPSAPVDQIYQLPLQQGEVPDPATLPSLQANAPGQLMTLDATRKFLVNSITGKPVFITGEDAFSLQAQLSDGDIQFYLNDRGTRGFNAIWVGLVDNTYNNHPPHDFYGNVPFSGADFTNENPAYWARVDQTLTWAAAQGITVLANPAFVGYGCTQGYCPSYRKAAVSVLTAYGQFLGNRYKNYSNIIWLIGGDADPTDKNVHSKLAALANGIRSADTVHLITTESYRGYSSEQVWKGAPWLDLDAIYEQPSNIVARAKADYQAAVHPVFMLEDWYEGEHSMTELEVREEGYWAVLSGSTLGRLFGNFAIWDFSWTGATNSPWKPQLGAEGSREQARLGRLFRSREHWKLVPDIKHQVLTAGYGSGNTLAVAARTSDGQTIIAYIPNGNATAVTIDLRKITDAKSSAVCWWFNPRDGSTTRIGALPTTGTHVFTPPDANDWVLVLDGQSPGLGAPGGNPH
jgi:hypothetical protein